MQVADGTTLEIADAGKVLTLDYLDALAAHPGESWFGVAVAYRMLQAAGEVLSGEKLWDRNDLVVVSSHPGDGVRDAVEFVTRCLSRGRYRVHGEDASGCRRGMSFSWDVADGKTIVVLRLRDRFVPDELYQLLDRNGTSSERPGDAARFVQLKRELERRVWNESLQRLFNVEVMAAGFASHA